MWGARGKWGLSSIVRFVVPKLTNKQKVPFRMADLTNQMKGLSVNDGM